VSDHSVELRQQRDDLAALADTVHALSAQSQSLATGVTALHAAMAEQSRTVSDLAGVVAGVHRRRPAWELALDMCAAAGAWVVVACLPRVHVSGSGRAAGALRLVMAVGRWWLTWRLFATMQAAARAATLRSDASTFRLVASLAFELMAASKQRA
jgi:hypothetical protein